MNKLLFLKGWLSYAEDLQIPEQVSELHKEPACWNSLWAKRMQLAKVLEWTMRGLGVSLGFDSTWLRKVGNHPTTSLGPTFLM